MQNGYSCRSKSFADVVFVRCCLPSGKGNASSASAAAHLSLANPGAVTQPPVEPPAVAARPAAHTGPRVTRCTSLCRHQHLRCRRQRWRPSTWQLTRPLTWPTPGIVKGMRRVLRHQIVLACLAMMLALASISAVVIVLRDHNWSLTALLGTEKQPELPATLPDVAGKSKPSSHVSAAHTDQSSADADRDSSRSKRRRIRRSARRRGWLT